MGINNMKLSLDSMRIDRDDAVLVAIDFQEKLMPAMADREFLEDRVIRLAKGVKALGIPKVVTEQYPRGLGSTISAIAEAMGDFSPIDKGTFSACGNEDFVKALEETGKKTVLLCGIETHICVLQTAFDLIEKGYKVVLIEDGCSSRSLRDSASALSRIAIAGAVVTTVEAALMEMIGGTQSPDFKAISKIIK